MGRGALIVFEGADRSGKTTQTHRCVSALRSAGVSISSNCPWRFPDRTTPTGIMINDYLTSQSDMDDHVLHLLFSANRWEKVKDIQATLTRGETIIIDRYAYSGVAYSAAKGLYVEWCKASDSGLPAPDAVVYLDLSLEEAQKRGNFGAERYENKNMQERVAKQFAAMRGDPRWHVVDASADEDTVFERVMEVVSPVVAKAANCTVPVDTLW